MSRRSLSSDGGGAATASTLYFRLEYLTARLAFRLPWLDDVGTIQFPSIPSSFQGPGVRRAGLGLAGQPRAAGGRFRAAANRDPIGPPLLALLPVSHRLRWGVFPLLLCLPFLPWPLKRHHFHPVTASIHPTVDSSQTRTADFSEFPYYSAAALLVNHTCCLPTARFPNSRFPASAPTPPRSLWLPASSFWPVASTVFHRVPHSSRPLRRHAEAPSYPIGVLGEVGIKTCSVPALTCYVVAD